MSPQLQYNPTFSGGLPTIDPVVLIAKWKLPTRPVSNRKTIEQKVDNLCQAIHAIPRIEITCKEFTNSQEEALQQQELMRKYLEITRSVLFHLRGDILKSIIRQVRLYLHNTRWPAKLQTLSQEAEKRTVETEQSLMFVLDEAPEVEWLPEPAPPGSFPKNQNAIPFEKN